MDRRRHHRDAELDLPWEVTLTVPHVAGRVVCEVLNISVGGAMLRIPRDTELAMCLGTSARFSIVDPRSSSGLELQATVVHRRTLAKSEQIGVRFDDPAQSEALLNPALVRKFNRRMNYRVEADAAQPPVWVTLEIPGHPEVALEPARMLDVATGGMAVLGSLRFERSIAEHLAVECTLFLPGTALPIVVLGQIVHRTLVNGGVRYGIEFAAATNEMSEATHDVILSYVIRRQRELVEASVNGQGPALEVPGVP